MSITGVSSTSSTNAYQATTAIQQVSQKAAADGDSPAVEAAESKATKAAEQANGGVAPKPKTAPASAGKSSSSANNLAKLRMLANEHLPVSVIARQMGISVSAVMQEATAAGIHLDAGSTATTGNPAVGNNVDTRA